MQAETAVLLTDVVQEAAHPLSGDIDDYNPLMDLIDNASLVLIGEASHGTHEFYRERAQITKRLIKEKGFTAVAVEADWPDAYRVNRYVQGLGSDADAVEALAGFKRFPAWMWRNADVLDFVGWLRTYNDDLPASAMKVGFYGLDLYSLHTSIGAVLDYLERIDPEATQRARARYACFDHFGRDEQAYGQATGLGLSRSCEDEVVSQLLELYQNSAEYAWRDGRFAPDEHFYATQNARLVRNAERYYRSMFRGRVSSWNLRDAHTVETLESLQTFLATQKPRPKKQSKARMQLWRLNQQTASPLSCDSVPLFFRRWSMLWQVEEFHGPTPAWLQGLLAIRIWMVAVLLRKRPAMLKGRVQAQTFKCGDMDLPGTGSRNVRHPKRSRLRV